jgi:hypothetical protein
MKTPECRISLADLSSAGIRLRPDEATAIAWDVIERAQHGHIPGIPSPNVIRFLSSGTIEIEGPVAPGQSIERAGRLLDALLPGFDAPPELRTPGALRIVVARALRTLDLPPYRSLDELSHAIARFAATNHAAVVRTLCAAWISAVSTHAEADAASAESVWPDSTGEETDLTISDIRRARRSTGLTLSEVAERSRIPVSLLRELEWGYFPNWPADQYGRVQLVRYARAAGLDEESVIRAVWPLVQTAIRTRSARVVDGTIVDDDDVGQDRDRTLDSAGLAVSSATVPELPQTASPLPKRALLAAGAIAALLTVAMLPAIWSDGPTEAPPAPTNPLPSAAVSVPTREPATESVGRTVPEAQTGSSKSNKSAQPPPQPAVLQDDVGFSPAFATAGSAMFYHTAARGSSAIVRADTDESGAVLRITSVVNDDAQNFHARPSPDGSMIAFDSDREGERAIFIANADGREVRRVTGDGFAAVPSWAPDGRRLAYVRAETGKPRVWNLWVVDLETGETTRLTSHRYGQPWGAAWFPDGRRIAYSHEDRLIVRSLDGGSQQVYASPRKGRLLRTPAVSPDGRWVMFQVYGDGGWLLDLSDASMQRILTDPTAEEFTWSPDGRQVAYHSRKSGSWNVWIMSPR